MALLHAVRFASDAALMGAGGLLCLLLAGMAWRGQVRRQRRSELDAVGWVPWSDLSVLLFACGLLLVLLAAIGLIKG